MSRWQGRRAYRQGRFRRYRIFAKGLVICVALVLMSGAAFVSAHGTKMTLKRPEGHGGVRGYWSSGIFAPNLMSLNNELTERAFGSLGGYFHLWGGGMYSESARISVSGFGGSGVYRSKKGTKRAQLNTGLGVVEVAHVWPRERSHIQVGAIFGGGGSALILSDGRPDSIEDAYDNRFDTYLTHSFAIVGPSIGARIDFSNYFGMLIKAGYMFALSGDWMDSGEVRLGAAPTLSGPFFMIGFSYGFGWGTHTHWSGGYKWERTD